MTQKRFTSKVVDWWHNVDEVRVVFDKGEWIDADNCAKLLNALYEENKQLKQIIGKDTIPRLMNGFEKSYKDLEKENDELKKEIISLKVELDTHKHPLWSTREAERIVNELKQEIEQLKQPNCRNCIHFSCDNADIYCMKKEYESIPDCSIAKDCDEYEGLYE